MTDVLDDPIREAIESMIAETPPLGPTPQLDTPVVERSGPRHTTWVAGAAAAVLAVGIAGVVVTAQRDGGRSGAQSATSTPTTSGVAVAAGRLAVVPGATDYYLGPESLGEPALDLSLFDSITRCVELDPQGVCTQIDGIKLVPLAVYGRSPEEPTVSIAGVNEVSIGTTFTGLTAEDYAADVGIDPAPTIVRGHTGVRYTEPGGAITVVWPERPGVLVWVTVPDSMPDQLATIAAGVRRIDGPTSIPDVVAVPNVASTPTTNNNASGLIVSHNADGSECIGMRYFETEGFCPASISTLTWVDARTDAAAPGFAVTGAVPDTVVTVRITPHNGEPVTVEPFSYAQYEHRFYRIDVEPSLALTVEWLDASGALIARSDQLANGNGGYPVNALVFDASGVPGAGENLAALVTGPYRGEPLGSGSGSPPEIRNAADGVERTIVYYDQGFLGNAPPEATTIAAWLGGADVERGGAELSELTAATNSLVVVLGADHGPEWTPETG